MVQSSPDKNFPDLCRVFFSLETSCDKTKRAILVFSNVSERSYHLDYQEILPVHPNTTAHNYTRLLPPKLHYAVLCCVQGYTGFNLIFFKAFHNVIYYIGKNQTCGQNKYFFNMYPKLDRKKKI